MLQGLLPLARHHTHTIRRSQASHCRLIPHPHSPPVTTHTTCPLNLPRQRAPCPRQVSRLGTPVAVVRQAAHAGARQALGINPRRSLLALSDNGLQSMWRDDHLMPCSTRRRLGSPRTANDTKVLVRSSLANTFQPPNCNACGPGADRPAPLQRGCMWVRERRRCRTMQRGERGAPRLGQMRAAACGAAPACVRTAAPEAPKPVPRSAGRKCGLSGVMAGQQRSGVCRRGRHGPPTSP